jgi:hypothetical protein
MVSTVTPRIPYYLTAVVDSIADLRALTSTYENYELYVKSWHSGGNRGGGYFVYDPDEVSADDGGLIIVDAAGRRWKRQYSGPLHAEWFGVVVDDNQEPTSADNVTNLKNAIKALFNSVSGNPQILEGGGSQITLNSKCELSPADIETGAGYKRNRKVIRGLNLRANPAGTWASGDPLLKIGGNQADGNLRNMTFDLCRFNASDITGVVPVIVSGYYNMNFRRCYFFAWTAYGFKSLGEDDSTGNHGLTIENCHCEGDFSSPAGKTGFYTEDGDTVFRGNTIEWMAVGIKSTRGSVKVEYNHFSLASGTEMVPAFVCVAPRLVSFVGNDCDGCYVDLNNYENNTFNGVHYSSWNNVDICHNDFSSGKDMPAGFGFINFRTDTASNFVTCLSIENNWSSYTGTGTPDLIKFSTSGAGTWLATFVSCINNPRVATVNPGSFPALIRLAVNSAYELQVDPSGALIPSVDGAMNLGTNANQFDEARIKTRYRIAGIQVVSSRKTGYTNAMTGTADRATSYATGSITLVQLAERVKAIEDDLISHGLIGA